jgi:GT2 family glycosyltransferase
LAPLVSIITVVFRAQHELPPLLESVRPHLGEDAEWIVIDGGSDDGTVEFLGEHNDVIDYWLSEPDRGIYDAINKGIASATGEYVLHLNAGDQLRQVPRGELEQCRADGVDLACFAVDFEGFGRHWPRPGTFLARFSMPWHHQGSFYRREGHMGYDTQFPVHADFDLNQRMIRAGKSIRCFKDVTVSRMGAGGVSSTETTHGESYRIVRKNFGIHYMVLCYLWVRLAWIIPILKSCKEFLHSPSQHSY